MVTISRQTPHGRAEQYDLQRKSQSCDTPVRMIGYVVGFDPLANCRYHINHPIGIHFILIYNLHSTFYTLPFSFSVFIFILHFSFLTFIFRS